MYQRANKTYYVTEYIDTETGEVLKKIGRKKEFIITKTEKNEEFRNTQKIVTTRNYVRRNQTNLFE